MGGVSQTLQFAHHHRDILVFDHIQAQRRQLALILVESFLSLTLSQNQSLVAIIKGNFVATQKRIADNSQIAGIDDAGRSLIATARGSNTEDRSIDAQFVDVQKIEFCRTSFYQFAVQTLKHTYAIKWVGYQVFHLALGNIIESGTGVNQEGNILFAVKGAFYSQSRHTQAGLGIKDDGTFGQRAFVWIFENYLAVFIINRNQEALQNIGADKAGRAFFLHLLETG